MSVYMCCSVLYLDLLTIWPIFTKIVCGHYTSGAHPDAIFGFLADDNNGVVVMRTCEVMVTRGNL
jgi:hypothetical protein